MSWICWALWKSSSSASVSLTARRCRVARTAMPLVLVIVRSVGSMAMSSVHVVDMVAVRHGRMAAAGAVFVRVGLGEVVVGRAGRLVERGELGPPPRQHRT